MKTLSIDEGLDKDGDHVVDTSELADALQDDSVTADAAENLAKAIDGDEKLSTPDDAVAGADDIVDVVDNDFSFYRGEDDVAQSGRHSQRFMS